MPGQTPIYSFPYPCVDEEVNYADFQALAEEIDSRMALIQDDMELALNRYNVQQTVSAQAGLVSGVETVIASAGSTYVAPVDGFYLGSLSVFFQGSTVLASSRARLRIAGTAVPGYTGFTTTTNQYVLTAVPIVATSGQTIDIAATYFGTGTGTISGRLDVRLVALIA